MQDEVRSYHSVKNFYSRVTTKCATDFEALFDFYVFLAGPDAGHVTVQEAFHPFAHAISSRATKKEEDETLCFASILLMDIKPLLDAPEDKRMETFFDMVGTVNSTIIFNTFPRLTTPGYRWAPKSFLGQSQHLSTVSNARSWEVKRSDGQVKPGGGLLVKFPGAELHISMTGSYLGPNFYLVPKKSSTWYIVRLQKNAEGNFLSWRDATPYAILSFEDIHKDSPQSQAIVAIIQNREAKGRIVVEPVARAIIEVVDDATVARLRNFARPYLESEKKFSDMEGEDPFGSIYPVSGVVHGRKQKWCVM
jgi:hypothetical protein